MMTGAISPSRGQFIKINPPAKVTESSLITICHRTVGERLSHLRTRAGLTLDMAAELTSISRAELCRIEKGTRRISDHHMMKLAAAYKVSLAGLKDIIDYKYEARIRVLPTATETRPVESESLSIPFYTLSQLKRYRNTRPIVRKRISIPSSITLSSSAYAIVLDTITDDELLPPDSLIIADPEKRARLGDLVLNNSDWSPIVIQINRDSDDRLCCKYGNETVTFAKDKQLHSFHKIAVLLPSMEQWSSFPVEA